MSIFNYKEKPGYFKRLGEALKDSREDLGRKINQIMGSEESPVREEQIEDLENSLIGADIGVQTTMEITDKIRDLTRRETVVTSHQVRRLIRSQLLEILQLTAQSPEEELRDGLNVILIVGVNGVGKTTTIGKLARHYQEEGRRVIFCAADTFRAAAIEQLDIWAERTGSEVIKQKTGTDPAAVLFDAIAAAQARGSNVLLVDTAGRLHNKDNLMKELEKMKRVAGREVPGAPHHVYLILDATTGQNGLVQAREFLRVTGTTGVIVTKLDGTARGGIVVAIAKELKVPIRFVGVGEKVEDLLPFDPESFVDGLLGTRAVAGKSPL